MLTTRRTVLLAATAALAPASRLLARQKLAGLKIGVTDWNLKRTGQPSALELGKSLGFEGVEVSLGRANGLALSDHAIQQQYLEAAKKSKIAIAGTCLDILHVNYLKSDPLGKKWVAEGIPVTQKLGARVMLLPFFGKGALTAASDQSYVADVLKELAPEAARAGVVLGLENTISAEDNARILDRVGSRAVRVYYDVGNSTNNGFDILKEIKWLGKDRICQIHLKDRGYLGEGKIDFPAVLGAIADIGFTGFANLETSSPSGSVESDMKRNLAFLRKLIDQPARG
ncbi:MAG TPA: sugar phosphate isomerase/epimerase family protein [Bryobacteraceae bacterium]|nr:sugar phosphate isomerase/epimerase family protein [Bryobacteraceae bacterium]